MRARHWVPIALLGVGAGLAFASTRTQSPAPTKPAARPEPPSCNPEVAALDDGFWADEAATEPTSASRLPSARAEVRHIDPSETLETAEYQAAQRVDETAVAARAGLTLAEFRRLHGDGIYGRLADEFLTQELMKDRLRSSEYPKGYPEELAEKSARDAAEQVVRDFAPAPRAQLLEQRLDSSDGSPPEVRFAAPGAEPQSISYTSAPPACIDPTLSPRVCS